VWALDEEDWAPTCGANEYLDIVHFSFDIDVDADDSVVFPIEGAANRIPPSPGSDDKVVETKVYERIQEHAHCGTARCIGSSNAYVAADPDEGSAVEERHMNATQNAHRMSKEKGCVGKWQ
jgi:hypothetical protein